MISCDYSHLAENGDTPPCWGEVSLVATTDAATGDPGCALTCQGHLGTVERGEYQAQGEPVQDAPVEPEVPTLSGLWDAPSEIDL
jgi:hypothetical protein